MNEIHPALVELYKNRKRKQKELWISNIVFCPRKEFISYFLGDLPEIDCVTSWQDYIYAI